MVPHKFVSSPDKSAGTHLQLQVVRSLRGVRGIVPDLRVRRLRGYPGCRGCRPDRALRAVRALRGLHAGRAVHWVLVDPRVQQVRVDPILHAVQVCQVVHQFQGYLQWSAAVKTCTVSEEIANLVDGSNAQNWEIENPKRFSESTLAAKPWAQCGSKAIAKRATHKTKGQPCLQMEILI